MSNSRYLNPFKYRLNQLFDVGFVIGIGSFYPTVGYYAAYCQGFVTHQAGQSGNGRSFHFVVGDFIFVEMEFFDFIIQMGVSQSDTQFSSCGP